MICIYYLYVVGVGIPFYVGATKSELKFRLSGHISGAYLYRDISNLSELTNLEFIGVCKKLDKKIGIRAIEYIPFDGVGIVRKREKYWYNYLVKRGYQLTNSIHRFTYSAY